MRTSIKAAVVLILFLAVAPNVSYAATRSSNDISGRGGNDGPVVRMIKIVTRFVVHILAEPTVPIPDAPH